MSEQKQNTIRWGAMLPFLLFMGVAGLFLYKLTFSEGGQMTLKSVLIGKVVPQFHLPPVPGLLDADGKPVPGFSGETLQNNGKLTILNVWASWCRSCRYEHKHLEELAHATGAQIYGFNYRDSASGARAFLRQYGNPYTAIGMATGRNGIDWGVHRVPETFIINEKGKIIYKYPGPIDKKVIHEMIIPGIAKAQAAGL